MAILDKISKIKNIQLVSSKLVESFFAGNYRSVFRGPGIEFDEVREYEENEDSRLIDWNVSSRMMKPYIKTFREERELDLFLIVDVSRSLSFGVKSESKLDTTYLLAGILAFAATYNNDKVGSILFTDQVEKWIPSRKGKKHSLRLIRDMIEMEPQGSGTELGLAVRTVYESLPRRGICFVISDFKTTTGFRELSLLARKHDVVAVNIVDPLDFSFPNTGAIELRDAESGRTMVGFGRSTRFRRAYSDFWYKKREEWFAACRRRNIDTLVIETEEDIGAALISFFKRRRA